MIQHLCLGYRNKLDPKCVVPCCLLMLDPTEELHPVDYLKWRCGSLKRFVWITGMCYVCIRITTFIRGRLKIAISASRFTTNLFFSVCFRTVKLELISLIEKLLLCILTHRLTKRDITQAEPLLISSGKPGYSRCFCGSTRFSNLALSVILFVLVVCLALALLWRTQGAGFRWFHSWLRPTGTSPHSPFTHYILPAWALGLLALTVAEKSIFNDYTMCLGNFLLHNKAIMPSI